MYERQPIPFYRNGPSPWPGPYHRPHFNYPFHSGPFPRQPMRGAGLFNRHANGRGGGFLARIFGKGNAPAGGFPGMFFAPTRGGAVSGGSLLKTLANPDAISGFLNNTQQILSAVQQVTPLVSQYGPLIRNLPAIWKLYRGLKDMGDEKEKDKSETSGESMSTDANDDEKQTKSQRRTGQKHTSDKKPSASNHYAFQDKRTEAKQIGHGGLKERGSFPKLYI
jgi:hypothetical protein